MKSLTAAAALVVTLAAAGCSGDSEGDTDTDTAAPAPAASSAEAAAPSESAAAGGGDNVLTGVVGTEQDPDAFEIALTDSSGAPVETLPAGEYTINVNDLSEIHNFHLTGGDVDETTTVPETGEKSFTVNLTAGEYEAICDPHPTMVTTFTVT